MSVIRKKNNNRIPKLHEFILRETQDFLDQFPEKKFISLSLKKSSTDFEIKIKSFKLLPDVRRICYKKLKNFINSKYRQSINILTILLKKNPRINCLYFQSTSADFHQSFKRSLIVSNQKFKYFIKYQRGCNTKSLEKLIKLTNLQDFLSVPSSFMEKDIEFQEVIEKDLEISKKNYFFSVGILLSFCDFFRLKDYHAENLIYSKSKFCLIDNEVVFCPQYSEDLFKEKKNSHLLKLITNSFLSTNILPIKFPDQERIKQTSNLIDMTEFSFYSDLIIKGFRYARNKIRITYKPININKLASDKQLKIRCIFRPTVFYTKLLERMSLSERFFEDKKFDFNILYKLNKYPKKLNDAYGLLCKKEKEILKLGCVPTFFWKKDDVCNYFFKQVNWPKNKTISKLFDTRNQEQLLRHVLTVFNEWKPNNVNVPIDIDFDKLISNYLNKTSKIIGVDKNTPFSILSIVNMPASGYKILNALDDSFYSGWAGFWNPSCIFYADPNTVFEECLNELNDLSNCSLTKGVVGRLRAIQLYGFLDSNKIVKLLDLIEERKLLLPIQPDGIFSNANGLWYLLCLIGSGKITNEISTRLKTMTQPFLNLTTHKCVGNEGWGLAHGKVGTLYLETTAQILFGKNKIKFSDWEKLVKNSANIKNGICDGVDGLSLALCSLHTISNQFYPHLLSLQHLLKNRKSENNDGLCHGYTGQLWSRIVLSNLLNNSKAHHFNSLEKNNQILQECIDNLSSLSLCDLSLFNGLTGKLLVQKLRVKSFKLSFDLFPSSSQLSYT